MRALVRPLIGHIYYGWVMLGAVSITEVVLWGILYYAFTVFVAPMCCLPQTATERSR